MLIQGSYDLPADVFEPGEVRPARKVKDRPAKLGHPNTKKRSYTAAQMDVSYLELDGGAALYDATDHLTSSVQGADGTGAKRRNPSGTVPTATG
jgi:hypothetical protein